MNRLPGILVAFAAGAGIVILVFFLYFYTPQEASLVTEQEPRLRPGKIAQETPPRDEEIESKSTPLLSKASEPPIPEDIPNLSIIQGRVLFGAGAVPLPFIPVRFSKEGLCRFERLTDGQGRFGIGFSGGGRWTATVYPFGNGGIHLVEEVEVEEGRTAFVEIAVPDRWVYDISGKVTGDDGTCISGVNVKLGGKWGAKVEETEVITGPNGRYEYRNMEVLFPKPKPFTPGSLGSSGDEEEAYRGPRMTGPLPRLLVEFTHPDYAKKKEWVEFSCGVKGRIVLDVRLVSPGLIAGTVATPEGEILDGEFMDYRFEIKYCSVGRRVKIIGNRFRIKIWDEGRLVVGGFVGGLWIDPVEFMGVDRKTRKEDIVLKARRSPEHFVSLVDQNGGPIGEGAGKIGACIIPINFPPQFLKLESGRILLPVFFSTPVTLRISGYGITDRTVGISPGNLPESIVLELLPVLLVGKLELPPAFGEGEKIEVHLRSLSAPGSRSTRVDFTKLDRETGEFELRALEGAGLDADYKVVMSIPGYKPWVKRIRPRQDGPPERVVVTFEK